MMLSTGYSPEIGSKKQVARQTKPAGQSHNPRSLAVIVRSSVAPPKHASVLRHREILSV